MTRIARYLPALLWMVLVYAFIAFTARTGPPPPPFSLRLVLGELRHGVAHTLVFAVQAALIVWPLLAQGHRLTRRDVALVLGTALLIGIGQEVLQAVLRDRAYPISTTLDLLADVGGAALGLWWMQRRWARRAERHAGQAAPTDQRATTRSRESWEKSTK